MIYAATSIEEVIGRVIRNTRPLPDMIQDMDEWIPEAMGYMKTRVVLSSRWACVRIHNHRGNLPCGLRTIMCVTCNGFRVPYYSGSLTHGSPAASTGKTTETSVFGSVIGSRGWVHDVGTIDETEGSFTDTKLIQINNLPLCEESYFTELGFITTSFHTGILTVYYKAIPMDEKGFPLIPDNEDYKEALYWYCRAKMIGTGYKDTVFNYQNCEERFEKHAARALGQIKYPSTDQEYVKITTAQSLVFPEGWWNEFFNNY